MIGVHGLLTIKNMDKLSGRTIGLDFVIANMVTDRAVYRIFINDMLGSHKRDVKLHRYPNRVKVGMYKLEYGSSYVLLSKPQISDMDSFCSAIENLIY
jgi:hypothetical protein